MLALPLGGLRFYVREETETHGHDLEQVFGALLSPAKNKPGSVKTPTAGQWKRLME